MFLLGKVNVTIVVLYHNLIHLNITQAIDHRVGFVNVCGVIQ